MTSGDFLAYGVPFSIFLATGFGNYWLAKRHLSTGIKIFWIGWGLLTMGMLSGVATLGTWDGLVYVALLIGISAPSVLGGVLGALVGRTKRERAEDDHTP
ncbi:hypothetical protein AN191_15905 [Loktanella sp. 5RATIMAR09]|uniref:hypothetical protein n=1 Tax=Loktanella sp. 5RATIMAR09 TaxID=1225655 RepID=UPI0006EBA799|nr:hypothetical protein [Loktanella sp. 5RATIMAR09]KQI70796.1 hypothetical protein AN191_15905 [Loktanella sp. 5RATIMAR09]